jgi:hypothetical protein
MEIVRLGTRDAYYVSWILRNKRLTDSMWSDGLGPENIDVEASLASSNIIFLKPVCADNDMGLIFAYPWNKATLECHIILQKRWRGEKGIEAGKLARDYLLNHTPYQKLIVRIADSNRHAIIFSLKLGFKKEGLVTKCYPKKGELLDLVIMGVSKEEVS